MREITSHVVNPANDKLKITVLDKPGAGGANHLYFISGFNAATNPSDSLQWMTPGAAILFQNGPIPEKGVNGVTQEALIAICIDRLQSFQNGPYACEENQQALNALEIAQHWLLSRTRARVARGVEGTHEV